MTIFIAFPGYEELCHKIYNQFKNTGSTAILGELIIRNFPDGETFVRLNTEVKNSDVILICGLDNPDQKAIALMFIANFVKEQGCIRIGIVAPYLGYMRQDKSFNPGEVVTSKIFAKFLSEHFDWLVTIDPHLHRYNTLSDIYSIPAKALHAAGSIATWVVNNVSNPILIGPDSESNQWVSEIAGLSGLPYIIMEKKRYSDVDVSISSPDLDSYKNCSPVILDDIISTGRTMIEVIKHLKQVRMADPICIGVHAIFSADSYEELLKAGAKRVITCNTIKHISNEIDISNLIVENIL